MHESWLPFIHPVRGVLENPRTERMSDKEKQRLLAVLAYLVDDGNHRVVHTFASGAPRHESSRPVGYRLERLNSERQPAPGEVDADQRRRILVAVFRKLLRQWLHRLFAESHRIRFRHA